MILDFSESLTNDQGYPSVEVRPSVVLSDGAKSIFRAVADCWPDAEHIICYAHMMRAVRRRLAKSIEPDVYEDLILTIREMHSCRSLRDFEELCEAALSRWPEEVATYRQGQWLQGPCSRWQIFRGRPDCPHSNQGQESFNRLLKDNFTFRKRCKMSECLDALCRAAQYVSDRIAEETGNRSLVGQNLGVFAFRVGASLPSESGRPPMAPIQPRF